MAFENELGVQAPVGFWDPAGESLTCLSNTPHVCIKRPLNLRNMAVGFLQFMYCTSQCIQKCSKCVCPMYACLRCMNLSSALRWNKTKLCMATTRQASPRTEAWRTSSAAVRPSWNMVEFPCWPPWDTSHQPLGLRVFFFSIPFLLTFSFKTYTSHQVAQRLLDLSFFPAKAYII